MNEVCYFATDHGARLMAVYHDIETSDSQRAEVMARGWTKYTYDRGAFGQLLEKLRAVCGMSYGALEQATGIPKASLQQAGKGARSLPELHRRRVIQVLEQAAATRGASMDRREFFRLGGLGALAVGSPKIRQPNTPMTGSEGTLATADELLQEAGRLSSQALWLEAEEKALTARARYAEGSREWAEITLRHCAQMRQQAGDIRTARFYLRDVEERYVSVQDNPDPLILALLRSQEGWIAAEQEGNFQKAYDAFSASVPPAGEAGDSAVLETGFHFRLRVLSEDAMTKLHGWLGSQSERPLSSTWITRLDQALGDAEMMTSRLGPNDPHVHFEYRRFLVHSMTRPYLARQAIPRLRALAKETDSEHHLALSLARWEMAAGETETAGALAKEAFRGFGSAAYPPGLAISAMIAAAAILETGLATAGQCRECLDLWILALSVHPYTSHPMWRVAMDGLRESAQFIDNRDERWLCSYFDDLDFRAWRGDGVFAPLRNLPAVVTQSPSLYVRHLLPETLRGKLWPELIGV